jgi:hypothetical protein
MKSMLVLEIMDGGMVNVDISMVGLVNRLESVLEMYVRIDDRSHSNVEKN